MKFSRMIFAGVLLSLAGFQVLAQKAGEATSWTVQTYREGASIGRAADARTTSTATARSWAVADYDRLLASAGVSEGDRKARVAEMGKLLKLSTLATSGASSCTWLLDADGSGSAPPVRSAPRRDYVVVTAQKVQ